MLNPFERDRHLYWTNFMLPNKLSERTNSGSLNQKSVIQDLCDFHDYDFRKYKGNQRMLKMARNLVDYEAGKTILETALNIYKKSDIQQTSIFDYEV
jgi:DNA (cytosine-5)-methyltransferase 1